MTEPATDHKPATPDGVSESAQTAGTIRQGRMGRGPFMLMLRSALNIAKRSEVRFARLAAERWLENYPADLEARLLHGLALLAEDPADAQLSTRTLALLDELCDADPEFWEAQAARLQIGRAGEAQQLALAAGCFYALDGEEGAAGIASGDPAATWSRALYTARRHLDAGDLLQAEGELNHALEESARARLQERIPLLGVTHLNIMRRSAPQTSANAGLLSLAEFYHQRWPDCLTITLILAALLMDGGDSERGVALLHEAAAGDSAGVTARRLWGRDHPYRSLWLEELDLALDLPVPAAVGAALGWNRLPPGAPAETVDVPQEDDEGVFLIDGDDFDGAAESEPRAAKGIDPETRQQLEGIAHSLHQPHLARRDGRFPVYVAWTSRQGLERLYGAGGAAAVDAALQTLVETLNRRTGWNAALLYADDPASAAALGIKPVPARDPWQLKLSLADLDRALGKQGRMIGALLIVGGPEIIPFHRLPNPVDDPDSDVPSDNPYAALDENYFVPEWPVGRISAGVGREAALLVRMLEWIAERHRAAPAERSWLLRFLETILGFFSPLGRGQKTSIGCTAAIWREASEAVFQPIGGSDEMLVSPPFDADQFLNGNLIPARLGYFNLHGVEDSPEWFGQRDPRSRQGLSQAEWLAGEDYPVALRPGNLDIGAGVPEFIFSEACYGAHIGGKTEDEALSLKFLSLGSRGLVGSTCTAYGSVTTPLSAADMLGRMFWENLRDGLPAGEALRRAKIDLAAETHRRQGFLDGEDQKTLIQFVLYGDPLAVYENNPQKAYRQTGREFGRSLEAHEVTTVQEQPQPESEAPLNADMLASVKEAVAKYLPGMEDARISLSGLYPEIPGSDAKGMNGKTAPKRYSAHSLPRQVVTLRKHVEAKNLTHESLARLTLDEDGVLIKMTVSR